MNTPFDNSASNGCFAAAGKLGAFVLCMVVVIAFAGGCLYVSTNNREVQLRNQIRAQQDVCKLSQDRMWKIIQQKAKVADAYSDRFKELFVSLMTERHYEKGGSLLKFVTEANPQFDAGMFKDLAASIEGERRSYFGEQKKLRDLSLQHENHIRSFPGSLVCSNTTTEPVTLITSSETERVYASGKDDNTDVFGNSSGKP